MCVANEDKGYEISVKPNDAIIRMKIEISSGDPL